MLVTGSLLIMQYAHAIERTQYTCAIFNMPVGPVGCTLIHLVTAKVMLQNMKHIDVLWERNQRIFILLTLKASYPPPALLVIDIVLECTRPQGFLYNVLLVTQFS